MRSELTFAEAKQIIKEVTLGRLKMKTKEGRLSYAISFSRLLLQITSKGGKAKCPQRMTTCTSFNAKTITLILIFQNM